VSVVSANRDIGGYVSEAKELLRRELVMPTGYALIWSGQYENMTRVRERMLIVVPLTLALITLLLYLNTKSAAKTAIVLMAVPFSLVGAVWLLWGLNYQMSIAVWVGMIALMGLDAETGVFMLLFLDLSWQEARERGLLRDEADADEAIVHGAVKRARPKMMTVAAAFMGHLSRVERHYESFFETAPSCSTGPSSPTATPRWSSPATVRRRRRCPPSRWCSAPSSTRASPPSTPSRPSRRSATSSSARRSSTTPSASGRRPTTVARRPPTPRSTRTSPHSGRRSRRTAAPPTPTRPCSATGST